MNAYPSMERARRAAQTRLSQPVGVQDPASAEWLNTLKGGPVSARGATAENAAFWRAVMAARDPRPVLMYAADLYLAEGRPGWARAIIFLTSLTGADPELQERLSEAEEAEADPWQAIEEGIALHDEGRFADSIAVYDQVIERCPGSAGARFEKALSLATLDSEANDEAMKSLCREAQQSDPFYAAPWRIHEHAETFTAEVVPVVYGGRRDRLALKRLAHGLQVLGRPELSALAWLQLMRQEPQDLEILGPLSQCLSVLGLDQTLDHLKLPGPVPPTTSGGIGADADLRRSVSWLRETVERAHLDGRADIAHATALLEMAAGLGPNDIEVALAHNLLAAIYQSDTQAALAESHSRQALMILEATTLPDDPNLVVVLHNLAAILMDQQRLPEARQFLRQALDVADDPQIRSTLLQTLARAELQLGNLDQAERSKEEAKAVIEGSQHADKRQAWDLLNLQADIARARGDYSRAVEYLEELLGSQTEALDADDLRLAVTQNNLATAREAQGSRESAEILLRKSLELRRRVLGESHPDVATAENNLGLLLARSDRLEEARTHLAAALSLRQAGLPEDDPLIPVTLVNLAEIETSLEARAEALQHLGEALELDIRLLDRLSEGRTPFERSILLADVGQRMGVLIWTALGYGADPAAQQLAAKCILARKGDPERTSAPQASDYRPAVRSLASLVLGGPRTRSQADYRFVLQQAEQRIEELHQLEPSVRPHRTARDRLTDVRRALGDQVLLEYVRIEPPGGPGHEGDIARYAVLVLGAAVLKVAWLGPCQRIDRLVRRFRETMDEAPAWVTGNERSAEARLRMTSQMLYQEVVGPVRDLLQDAAGVLVAPDGELHLVPFGVLASPDGRYLLEDLEFVTVSSGSDLLRKPPWPNSGGDVCVFVDPDFDLEPPHALQEHTVLHHNRISQYLAGANWTRLEGTRDEARAILEALPEETVRIYSGADASEASLFRLQSPRILHISTHGFFLKEDELPPLPPAGDRGFEMGVPSMLCSGLALAGARTLGHRSVSGVANKGVITALEVATLDLRGTEVVVLSGCETAVGSPVPGEGVLGLRRAFLQAGADQLVSSLWKVPEAESAALLRRFYRHLGDGEDPATALRAGCLEMLQERRATSGAAHPLFWGGFIAIGVPHALRAVGVRLPDKDGERLELPLQDDIQVVAIAHTLDADGPLPVITLVTQGLADAGGHELALTVPRESPLPPRHLLAVFGAALAATRAGQPPAIGELLPARGGAAGLPGFGRLERGLVWHPNALAAMPETAGALTVQFLTEREARHLDVLGPLRLMARLGQACRFYPTAPWVDPGRRPLIEEGELDDSILAHCHSLLLPDTRISRISRAGREGLSIEVGPEQAQRLEHLLESDVERLEQFSEPGDAVGMSLLGHEDPEADGIMVWRTGAPPTVIIPGTRRPSRLALNFVLVMRGDEDRLGWIEDGAMWTLSPQTWAQLRMAIAERDVLTTEAGGMPVRWAWVVAAEAEGPVRLEAVHLLTPDEQAEEALTVGEQVGLVKRTTHAVREAIGDVHRSPVKLLVGLSLQRDGGLRVDYKSSGPEAKDLYPAIDAALGRQYWPMLPGGEFEVAMRFGLWEPTGVSGPSRTMTSGSARSAPLTGITSSLRRIPIKAKAWLSRQVK